MLQPEGLPCEAKPDQPGSLKTLHEGFKPTVYRGIRCKTDAKS